jgi:hypothetical protein
VARGGVRTSVLGTGETTLVATLLRSALLRSTALLGSTTLSGSLLDGSLLSGSIVTGGGGGGGSITTSSGGITTSRSGAGGARPDLGAGHGESLGSVVDGEVGVLIGLLVGTGELGHLGVDLAGATTGNLDLSTRDVVLGLVDVRSVDTDVLNAEEVLAVGGTLGDLDIGGRRVVVAPGVLGEVTAGVADTLLHDLEPVTGAVVGLDITTGIGHVSQSRSGVAHLGTDSELEGDHITTLNLKNLSVGTGLGSALVADDVITVNEGVVADVGGRVGGELDGVVLGRTGEVTDVLEGLGLGAVESRGLEEVMGRSNLREGSDGEGGELHVERLVVWDSKNLYWFVCAGDWLG